MAAGKIIAVLGIYGGVLSGRTAARHHCGIPLSFADLVFAGRSMPLGDLETLSLMRTIHLTRNALMEQTGGDTTDGRYRPLSLDLQVVQNDGPVYGRPGLCGIW